MVPQACSDILKAFKKGNNRDELIRILFALPGHCYLNPITQEGLDALIKLEEEVMNAKGQYKKYIEEKILQILSGISFEGDKKRSEGLLFRFSIPKKGYKEQKALMAEKLKNLASQIFLMKKERDAFSNKRKGFALGILGKIAVVYDCPEASEKCLMALRSKKNALILAALEFLDEHYIIQKRQLTQNIIDALDNIVDQTKSRSTAVGALDIQVRAGEITELGALAEIDDWKERNYSRYSNGNTRF